MITDSMRPAELHKVMEAATREARGRCNMRTKPIVDKAIRTNSVKLPSKGHFEYERDHTKYVVMYVIQYFNGCICVSPDVYAVYESGYGRKAVIRVNKRLLIEFGPHFFDRYAERNHVDKHGDDLILHFMMHNSHVAWQQEFKRKDGDANDMMFSCDEGAMFGQMYSDGEGSDMLFAFEAVTFLSNDDMTGTKKSDITKEYRKYLEEAMEIEKKFGRVTKVIKQE